MSNFINILIVITTICGVIGELKNRKTDFSSYEEENSEKEYFENIKKKTKKKIDNKKVKQSVNIQPIINVNDTIGYEENFDLKEEKLDLKNAIIVAEILGKPKCRTRRR